MVFGLRRVLRHHACENVRLVGLFQIADLLRTEPQVHGADRTVNMVLCVAPTTGAVTLVSSQASEISVMET